jgi:hypothetical protein
LGSEKPVLPESTLDGSHPLGREPFRRNGYQAAISLERAIDDLGCAVPLIDPLWANPISFAEFVKQLQHLEFCKLKAVLNPLVAK